MNKKWLAWIFLAVGLFLCTTTVVNLILTADKASAEELFNDEQQTFSVRLECPIIYQLNTGSSVIPSFYAYYLPFTSILKKSQDGVVRSIDIIPYQFSPTSIDLTLGSSYQHGVYLNYLQSNSSASGSSSQQVIFYVDTFNEDICLLDNLSAIQQRGSGNFMYYDFMFGDDRAIGFTFHFTPPPAWIVSASRPWLPPDYNFSIDDVVGVSLLDSYQTGYDRGYDDGQKVAIDDINPLNVVINAADNFLKISPFGNNVTFGTFLSLGFGIILLGLCIKIFLGG